MNVTAEHLHEELFSWLDATKESAPSSTGVERDINAEVIEHLTTQLGRVSYFYEDISSYDSGVLFTENLNDAERDVTNVVVAMVTDPGRFHGDYDDSGDTGVDYVHDNYDDIALVVGHHMVDEEGYAPAEIIDTYWAMVAEKVINHYYDSLPALCYNILNLGDVYL